MSQIYNIPNFQETSREKRKLFKSSAEGLRQLGVSVASAVVLNLFLSSYSSVQVSRGS